VKTARTGIGMTMKYTKNANGNFIPVVRDIDIRDCKFEKLLRQPVFIEGFSELAQITDVTIANCKFPEGAGKNTITNAARINIVNNSK
jgi:hypothetical protein